MTISELIERLRQFPLDMTVMTPGFDEAGYDPVNTVEQIDVVQVRAEPGHVGMFEATGDLRDSDRRLGPAKSVVVVNW